MEENKMIPDDQPNHRAGFVSIVGKPNVGKSTLMNQVVGEKLSIITAKAQTTRHRIMGILSAQDFQVVYSDTPGLIEPKYALQESMMAFVRGALEDADIILWVMDILDPSEEKKMIETLNDLQIPVFLVLNKIDKIGKQALEEKMEFWKRNFPQAQEIIPISALENANVDTLFEKVVEHLPLHPPYFPKGELTDKSERFFASEIIREKIFLHYKQEIPYATEVIIESFKEEEDIIRIRAEILVERNSQKGIIIGKRGEGLKKVGTEARLDLEAFFGKKIYLEQFVKVEEQWRKKTNKLRRLGY